MSSFTCRAAAALFAGVLLAGPALAGDADGTEPTRSRLAHSGGDGDASDPTRRVQERTAPAFSLLTGSTPKFRPFGLRASGDPDAGNPVKPAPMRRASGDPDAGPPL